MEVGLRCGGCPAVAHTLADAFAKCWGQPVGTARVVYRHRSRSPISHLTGASFDLPILVPTFDRYVKERDLAGRMIVAAKAPPEILSKLRARLGPMLTEYRRPVVDRRQRFDPVDDALRR